MKELFIVIEGTDGTGKGTQLKVLANRLKNAGHAVELFDFPQYGQPSAWFAERYLNGDFGALDDIGAYKGSLFFAIDRYAAAFAIKDALRQGRVVLSNRYVGSNLGHQGGKIVDNNKRKKFFEWAEHLEFSILGSPQPTLNIVLHSPAEVAQQMVDLKETRGYTNKKRDLHEADLDHLKQAEKAYLQMCELFPKVFTRIECAEGGTIDSIEVISQRIWDQVKPLLATK